MTDKMLSGIRDSVHRWIPISNEEKKVLDSPYVQRLRYLHQLEFVYFVYPGAEHSRFCHSIGAMHLAGIWAKHLWPKDEEKQSLCRIVALLHDFAHGPFSHLWDRVVYSKIYNVEKGHDKHRIYLMEHAAPLRQLVTDCGVNPDDVIRVWKDEECAEHEVTQGRIGADRMDYMLRDSKNTGMEHFGSISPERIIAKSFIEIKDGKERVKFPANVNDEINFALKGKDELYKNVYRHPKAERASRLAEKMIVEAMEGGLPFKEMTMDVEKFLKLDDYSVLGMIDFHPDSKSVKAKEMAFALKYRSF